MWTISSRRWVASVLFCWDELRDDDDKNDFNDDGDTGIYDEVCNVSDDF